MEWGDYVRAILAGGLPAVLDGNRTPGAPVQGDTRPEARAPAGTIQDRESFAATASALPGGPWVWVAGVALLIVGLAIAARH